eukprot:5403705-Alexandrium_andersonii.AAC.1
MCIRDRTTVSLDEAIPDIGDCVGCRGPIPDGDGGFFHADIECTTGAFERTVTDKDQWPAAHVVGRST